MRIHTKLCNVWLIKSLFNSFLDIPLETLYGGEDEDSSYDEPDADYVRKTIMVGSAYQAVIPNGLSKYGDVLPYENEDKLIWEPCQVSEKEVEDYLIQTRDIKNILSEKDQGEEDVSIDEEQDAQNVSSNVLYKNSDLQRNDEEKRINVKISDTEKRPNPKGVSENEIAKVVKDNEQVSLFIFFILGSKGHISILHLILTWILKWRLLTRVH